MNESFRGRLRRLRRDDTPALERASAGEGADASASAAEVRARLGAARRRRGSRRADDPRTTPDLDGHDLWPRSPRPPAFVVEHAHRAGTFAARTTWFDADWSHGSWRLAEACDADPDDFVLTTGDASLAGLAPTRAVYLDTETTGLSGGAGTSVFLIGLGRFVGDRFELWQGFLRSPAEERALLAECADRIARSGGVVSYFGKSFDRHRLEDKMRVHGVDPPFDAVPHLDLCHPLKRLYRPPLPDGRLRTMESALVGVARDDDLPGSHAPEAWFDFLAGRPHRVEGVFQHNLDDVLSLVTLAGHLGRVRAEARACGTPLAGDAGARAAGIARSLLDRRLRGDALPWLDLALERVEDGDAARSLALAQAEALRLERRGDEALGAFRALCAAPEDRHTVDALLGAAKLLEHHRRDAAGALELCRTALAVVDRRLVGGGFARAKRDLERRVARLASAAER